jgi:negative regulator of sigma E activity
VAAYAESRLGTAGGDPETDPAIIAVEAWLAHRPEALDDLVAARQTDTAAAASEAVIARAQALIVPRAANIVPFRAPRPAWRSAVTWTGIAASLMAASLVGFTIGADEWLNLSDSGQNPVLEQALNGPPATILTTGDEEEGGI